MAKYIGPACRLCRREGEKLFLKGERCFTAKCAFDRRGFAPGQHGRSYVGRSDRFQTMAASCAPSKKPAASTGCMNDNSAATMERHCRHAV